MAETHTSWMESNGGYNGYYMVAVWYSFTDAQQNDILNEYPDEE